MKDKQKFLGELMMWCFKWGCEVQLRNRAQNFPPMNPVKDAFAVGEFYERMADGTLIDMSHRTNYKVIEVPELVFSRGEKHVSVIGHTWDDLLRNLEYSHRKIYMDLSVPMLPSVTGEGE